MASSSTSSSISTSTSAVNKKRDGKEQEYESKPLEWGLKRSRYWRAGQEVPPAEHVAIARDVEEVCASTLFDLAAAKILCELSDN